MLLMLVGCVIYKDLATEAVYDLRIKTWDGVPCRDLDRYPDQLRSGMPSNELSGLIQCEYSVRDPDEPAYLEVWKYRSPEHVLKVKLVSGRVNSWELTER